MKAAVCTAYGGPDVVEVRDVPAPIAKPDEVLIRVFASTVASGDARVRGARFPKGFGLLGRLFLGLTRPRTPILGTELAGVVEAVGAKVKRYRPGDEVFAFSGVGMGCHAELKAMPEDGPIALIPGGFTYGEAAAISFGGTTALYFLRNLADVQPGERVLINGASGAVGSAAVQLARHFGAHVTGVCSAANAGLVRSLGADEVIDYAEADFARCDARWDVILDTVGNGLIGSYRVLAEAVRRHRLEADQAEVFVARLLGLSIGQDQIDRGKNFVGGVIERAGEPGLARLWESARCLPTPADVDAPGLWLARIELPELPT